MPMFLEVLYSPDLHATSKKFSWTTQTENALLIHLILTIDFVEDCNEII